MLSLPPSLALFKPSDTQSQRFLTPIERTVTALLTFLRTNFDDAANASLRMLKPLILKSLTTDDLTANNASLFNNGFKTLGRANIAAGLDTPSGIKTILGQFGYTGNSTAGYYYNLGSAYFSNNVQALMPYAGSLVGGFLSAYTPTAMTMSAYVSGMSGGEYRYDMAVPANAIQTYSFTLPRGQYYFNVGNYVVTKLYTPTAATGISFVIAPIVEFAT